MTIKRGRLPSCLPVVAQMALLWLLVQRCLAEGCVISELTRQGIPVGLIIKWPAPDATLQLGASGSGSSGWRLFNACSKVAHLLSVLPTDCHSFQFTEKESASKTCGAAEPCGASLSCLGEGCEEKPSLCELDARTRHLPPLRTAIVLPAPVDPVLEAAIFDRSSHAPSQAERSLGGRDGEPSHVGLWFADGLRMPHEAGLDTCTSQDSQAFAVKELQRELRGAGAHRQLVTTVKLEESLVPGEKVGELVVALLQPLPSGVYADKFEVHRLAAEAAASIASIYGPVDIERPAPECTQSLVVVYAPLRRTASGTLEATITVPLHARYPAVAKATDVQPEQTPTHTTIHVGLPLSILWSDSADLSTEQGLRMHTSWHHAVVWMQGLGEESDVQWDVPRGKQEHAGMVRAGTASACLAGTLYVLAVVFRKRI